MFRSTRSLAISLCLCLFHVSAANAVVVGQVDDFEDGTTMGWRAGAPLPGAPSNVADGGPNGAGDNFLRITSTGTVSAQQANPLSKLTAFNLGPAPGFAPLQWAGDYLAAGVGAITMDVNNFGATDLSLRLLIADVAFANIVVTDAVAVAAQSPDWQSISFGVDAGAVTVLFGDAITALANANVLRLYHAPNPVPPNVVLPIAAELGVDNISAVPVPAAIYFLLSGLIATGFGSRRLRTG